MKKLIIGIIILSIVSFSVFFIFNKSEKAPRFKTEEIKKGDITEVVTASGVVNPVISISVGTQVSGTLKALYVDFNSPVKKGQLLAEIDPSLFEAQVEQARANLYNAQANYQKVRSLMINDQKTYNRYSSLYKQNFVAKSEVDLAEANYYSSKAQIDSARAQIAQASAALRNNLTNLRYTKIISPVDGIVVSRNVDVGQTVAASFQTPTLFLVAKDLTKMQIDTSVAEADIGKIKTGQDVEYTLDGYPDMTFKGIVKQIRISPTTVQNVVTYDVVINVDNKDLKLKPGMTANVSIITSSKKNILMVPNACLRFTPFDGRDAVKYKEQGIWILAEKEPKRIPIKTGVSDGSFTEIISSEIAVGQKIIIEKLEKERSNKGGGAPRMRML